MTSRCSHCKRLFWFTEILGKNGPWAPLIPGLSKRQSNVMFTFFKAGYALPCYRQAVSLRVSSVLGFSVRSIKHVQIDALQLDLPSDVWYWDKIFHDSKFHVKICFHWRFFILFFIFKSTMYEWLSFAPDDASQPSLPSFIISPLLHILSQVFLCGSYLTVIKMYCFWIPQCSLCSALPANLSS